MAFEERIDIKKGSEEPSATVKFDPNPLNVTTGDLVFWTNHDSVPHWPGRLREDGKTILKEYFMPYQLAPGGDSSPHFSTSKTGSIKYACSLHPEERGEIIVKS